MKHVLKLLEMAIQEAQKSTMLYRHSAILFNRNNIYGCAHNYSVHNFLQASIHAEMASICAHKLRLHKIKKYDILVTRLTANGKLTYSRPCQHCFDVLRKMGVRRIYYSDFTGDIICEKIAQMNSQKLCVSSGTRFRRKH